MIERYKFTPDFSPEVTPQIMRDVTIAGHQAYEEVGSMYGISPSQVYRTGTCFDVSDAMMPYLQDRGYSLYPTDVSFMFVDHHYLRFSPPDSKQIFLADGTWQQFAQKESCKGLLLPKILIGTPEGVAQQLHSYGFNEEEVSPWGRLKKS